MREDIIGLFEKGIFSFNSNVLKTKEEIKEKTKEEIKRFINNSINLIERESKGINNDLCKKHFDFATPIDLAKNIFETKDANKNVELAEEIKNRWSNSKDKIV